MTQKQPRKYDAVLGGNKPGPLPGSAVLGGEEGRRRMWLRAKTRTITYCGIEVNTPLMDEEAIAEIFRLEDKTYLKEVAVALKLFPDINPKNYYLFLLHFYLIRSRGEKRSLKIENYDQPEIVTLLSDEEAANYTRYLDGKFGESLWDAVADGYTLSEKQLYWAHRLAMEDLTNFYSGLKDEYQKRISSQLLSEIEKMLYPPHFKHGGYPEIKLQYDGYFYWFERKEGNIKITCLQNEKSKSPATTHTAIILFKNKWLGRELAIPEIERQCDRTLSEIIRLYELFQDWGTDKVKVWYYQNKERCFFCGGWLKSKISKQLGYGPTCAQKLTR
jgi:hypothetical protein